VRMGGGGGKSSHKRPFICEHVIHGLDMDVTRQHLVVDCVKAQVATQFKRSHIHLLVGPYIVTMYTIHIHLRPGV
jgi:hypothetical protein